jgi:hypothetical protein
VAQKYGEVVESGPFSLEPANWVHIRYSHADEAQRALLRNGYQVRALRLSSQCTG